MKSYFWFTFFLLTVEYLLHTVLDWKVIGPQANSTSQRAWFDTDSKYQQCVPDVNVVGSGVGLRTDNSPRHSNSDYAMEAKLRNFNFTDFSTSNPFKLFRNDKSSSSSFLVATSSSYCLYCKIQLVNLFGKIVGGRFVTIWLAAGCQTN